jgi:transcriptional regulator with XRE-family HTH domain
MDMDTTALLRLTSARRLARTGRGRELRLGAGLSLGEVAGAVGVGESTVYRWERAERMPRGEPAIAWAELCDRLEADLRSVS